jgi:hypothetical protein
MRFALIALLWLLGIGAALADEAQDCQANAGHYVTGTVQNEPSFSRGHDRGGVELSHTRLTLLGDDGVTYDVRIDNVFASGYDQAGENVPAPLSSIKSGDKLDLCGNVYNTNYGGQGMDWVHTNCGATPVPSKPNGWIKLIDTSAVPGPNLDAANEYCSLWP